MDISWNNHTGAIATGPPKAPKTLKKVEHGPPRPDNERVEMGTRAHPSQIWFVLARLRIPTGNFFQECPSQAGLERLGDNPHPPTGLDMAPLENGGSPGSGHWSTNPPGGFNRSAGKITGLPHHRLTKIMSPAYGVKLGLMKIWFRHQLATSCCLMKQNIYTKRCIMDMDILISSPICSLFPHHRGAEKPL